MGHDERRPSRKESFLNISSPSTVSSEEKESPTSASKLAGGTHHDTFNDEFIIPLRKILEQAVFLSSPSVQEIQWVVKVPAWMKEVCCGEAVLAVG